MDNFKFSIVTEVEGVLVKMERAEFNDFTIQFPNGGFSGVGTVVSFGENDYGKFKWNQRNAVACPSSQSDVGPMFFAYCEAVRSFINGKLSVYQQTLEDLNKLDPALNQLLKSRLTQDAIQSFFYRNQTQLVRDTTLAYSAKKEAEELDRSMARLDSHLAPRRVNGICL